LQDTDLSPSAYPRALLRFSKAKWHSHTITSEKLRFTPVEEWRRLEGADDARGDAWEGATKIGQPVDIKSVKLQFSSDPSGQWIEHKLVGPIVHLGGLTDFPATHDVCFNMLTNQSVTEAISKGQNNIDLNRFRKEFGPSLLVVDDVPKFLQLVICAIGKSNIAIETSSHGLVKYVDQKSFSGAYTIYHKPMHFGWQQEFRIAVSVQNGENKPIFLHVPGLNEVCNIIEDLESKIDLIRNNDGSTSVSISQRVSSGTNG